MNGATKNTQRGFGVSGLHQWGVDGHSALVLCVWAVWAKTYGMSVY